MTLPPFRARFLLSLSATLACSAVAWGCGGSDTAPTTEQPPTYYQNVKPILDAKCTKCHVEGGIAPFSLTSYADAGPYAQLIRAAVESRTMPPWLASPDHEPLMFDETLSETQIATVGAWVDAGAPEGDASKEAAPLQVDHGGLSRVDLTLTMPEAYTPEVFPDDYRCFVMDWPLDKPTFVTGYNSVPGNHAVVHHTLAFLISPDYVPRVEGFDAAEEGPGYRCFGGPTAEGEEQFPISFMGAWAPGMGGVDLPPSTGIMVDPGSKVVLQVHYNSTPQSSGPDQTSMQFSVSDDVATEGFYVPFFDVRWYFDPKTMTVPAGDADAMHSFQDDPNTNITVLGLTRGTKFPNGMKVYSTLLHQHVLGHDISISKAKSADARTLIEIPKWDFHWQREFFFQSPEEVLPGEELLLECHWDNSAAGQPWVDGVQGTPKDVTWGEGTSDEMCVSFLYITPL